MTNVRVTKKESDTIHNIDESAAEAQKNITEAAKNAQKIIDDACAAAVATLELATRIPDKRNLNGSYQWNKPDRGQEANGRIKRLEDKVEYNTGLIGSLQVGQAKREEQIIALIDDVTELKETVGHFQTNYSMSMKEQDGRMVTLRELVLEVRGNLSREIVTTGDALTKEINEYKSRNLWQLVLVLSTAMFTIIFFIVNRFVQI